MKQWLTNLRLFLTRQWLECELRHVRVRLAREREEVAYLEEFARDHPCHPDFPLDLAAAQTYVSALEDKRNNLEAAIRELLISP